MPVKKTTKKKPYYTELDEKIKRIHDAPLSELGLFELSIRALMSTDVFREIKTRLLRISDLLERGKTKAAKDIVDGLLMSPGERRLS